MSEVAAASEVFPGLPLIVGRGASTVFCSFIPPPSAEKMGCSHSILQLLAFRVSSGSPDGDEHVKSHVSKSSVMARKQDRCTGGGGVASRA